MKTIEEKAKAYDKAIKIAMNNQNCFVKDVIEDIFPELKESEDERIRKEMIFYFTEEIPQCSIQEHSDKMRVFISWLKKQEVERTKLELKAGSSYFCYKSRYERADNETFKKGLIYKCNKDGVLDNFVIKNPEQHFIEIKDERIAWLEKQGEQKCTAEEVLIKAGLKPYKDGDQWCILLGDNIQEGICGFGNTIDDALYAFLNDLIKSQKEQKPVDKVEPKFKVGDWVIVHNKDAYQVIGVNTYDYRLQHYLGGKMNYPFKYESDLKHWTIKDAKDGDVLFTSSTASHETFIFKNIDERGNVECYFAYDSEDGFREGKHHFIGSATNCKPATKEQYDALMKAMSDAGYEWDAEKKLLKKIEEKPAWSEEDERIYRGIHNLIYSTPYCDSRKELSDWLKSLKDRVQLKKEGKKN